MSGSLEQFPSGQLADGIGTATETFSNIKTSAAVRRAQTAPAHLSQSVAASSVKAASVVRAVYRPRFVAHAGLLVLAGVVVLSNSPVRTHALSLRLTSAQAGIGSTLDEVGQAAVAADIASSANMMVTTEATKTATAKTAQVSLLTSDDLSLAKRQVVQTAGNATRDITSYTVANGDTLSGIAAKFNITSATLVAANNLASADAIKPGQSLTILPVSGLLYTVQSGDTADTLASKYSANAAQITSYNNAEVKGLTPGTKIIIPDGVMPQAPAAAVAAAPAAAVSSRSTISPSSAPKLTAFYGAANGYSFGYCTWYVANRRSVPSNWGNANAWYYNAQASGFSVGSTPVPGAIAWSGAGYYGHVAYVESVSGGNVTISEMNFNGNWDKVTYRTVSASSFRYIY
ncbi:LysM peptidoglycan-binding domain-containing protein [Candidatus Saccharibacteria bacterium]|nr:LysM peptidoglycan-binding domain-containing protein [Candidatus Saccharibacteria bacterium]